MTTSCSAIDLPEIQFIDSPGFNDSNPKRADDILSRELIHYLKMNKVMMQQSGLSCVVQCIMVPEGKRIAMSNAETLVRFLMSLTISYPGYPLDILQNGFFPKVMIIFTALSRYDFESQSPGRKVAGKKSSKPQKTA